MKSHMSRLLIMPTLCLLAVPIPFALAAKPEAKPGGGAAAASVITQRAADAARAHSVVVTETAAAPAVATPEPAPAAEAVPEFVPAGASAEPPAAAIPDAAPAGVSAAVEVAPAASEQSAQAPVDSMERQAAGVPQGNDAAPSVSSAAVSTTSGSVAPAGTTVESSAASTSAAAAVPAASRPEDFIIVELASPAAARYTGGIKGLEATAPRGGRFDSSSAAYAAYRKHLDNEHAAFRAALSRAAPTAQIVRELRITANAVAVQLNGTHPAAVERLSGAKRVYPVGLYRPTMNESVSRIDLDGAWAQTTRANAGQGIRVGVIDSGIPDALYAQFGLDFHPFFHCKDPLLGGFFYSGETGAPAIEVKNENGNIPAPGVAWVEPHGNHVAGTIGGCVTEIADGPWTGVQLSGVAPGSTLVDYNVFPGIGAGFVAQDGSAFSHDIADAIETSVANGDHVINMSLGGGVQGPNDFLAQVANAAVAAGVVVVASNGNEGPDPFTNGSPGSAKDVIAVGATTNTRGMGVEIHANVDGAEGDEIIKAYPGEFPNFDGSTETVIDWPGSDNQACTSDVDPGSLDGEVVLIARGTCFFSEKMASAKAAGAGGVIVYSDTRPAGAMAVEPGYDDQIPAVMVSNSDGLALEAAANAAAQVPEPYLATISGIIIVPETPDQLADFSSRGPAPFTGTIKPDVVAPGVNILSSVFSGYELYDGTSMASPHVAGAAAILLEQNPGWTPAQVKSALATTATDLGLKPWEQGSGLIQVDKALETNAFFAPTNASFGIFTGKAPANGVVQIAVDSAATCSVGTITGAGSGVTVVAELEDGTLSISFDAGRTAPGGLYGGNVTVDCDTQSHTIPWAAVVNR